MFLELLLIAAGAFALINWLQRRQIQRTGRKLKEDLDAAFSGDHEFVSVLADDFRHHLDLEFYTRVLHELEQEGFRWVDDVEDVTLSGRFPANRTFQRLLVTPEGKMRANIYHLKPQGVLYRVLSALYVVPREYHVIELATEFSAGYTLITNNTKGAPSLDMPRQLDILAMDPDTPTSELVSLHRRRIDHFLEQCPGDQHHGATERDDLVDAIRRILIMCQRYRRQEGYSLEELERISGKAGSRSAVKQLHQELNRTDNQV